MKKQSKKKRGLSWGTGLTIAIVLFMIGTLSIVFFAVSLDYHMVTEDYYQRAENYQQHINRVEETATLEDPVQIEYQSNLKAIQLQFPVAALTDPVTGVVELYRPNDSSLDRTFELNPDESGIQQISVENFVKGRWLVRINWSSGDRNFFEETTLFF